MKLLEIIKNHFKLFFFRGDEAIKTCYKKNIALTEKNVNEVREIIKHRKKLISNSKSF